MSASAANPGRTVSLIAMLGAGVLIAHQVTGKVVRDAVFLSNYEAKSLPAMIAGGAAVAVLMGVLSSRLLSRLTPSRIVPWAFGISSLLHLGEWYLMGTNPKLTAVLLYLHIVALGAVLLSGFWSLTNELLDPHTAKHWFGQIAGAGTLGGILGGLTTERIAAWYGTQSVIIWLVLLHLIAMIVLLSMRFYATRAAGQRHPRWWSEPRVPARQAFSKAPYLFSVGGLVLITATSAAAVHWVFNAQSRAYFGPGEGLTRFFALFQTSVQVLTLIVQTFATRLFLERFGLGRTAGALPLAVSLGGLGALFFPVFPVITALRGTEFVLRGSLFRSGVELFYTPVPVAEKRSAKAIIDVGLDRLGDAVGSGVVQFFIVLGSVEAAANRILLTVVGLAVAGMVVARRLDRGYVQALEKSLVNRAVELDFSDVRDSTTRIAVLHMTGQIPIVQTHPPPAAELTSPGVATDKPELARLPARPLEPVVQRFADLRSGRPARVRAALLLSDPLDPLLAAQVTCLLAWDEVTDLARDVLTKAAPRICGQLLDFLLDEKQDFAIRRRIPRVLLGCPSQRVVNGLIAALGDSRFEVRFQSGRVLNTLLDENASLNVEPSKIFAVVERELSVSRSVWHGHRLLDRRDPSEQTQFLDEVLRERAHASLEHVFTLLALVLPREPLKVAFRALHTQDPLLRGLALEYIEAVLPENVREKLSRIVEHHSEGEPKRTGDEILASLMQSNQSVILLLRERMDEPAGRE